jgi:hypothetical protein
VGHHGEELVLAAVGGLGIGPRGALALAGEAALQALTSRLGPLGPGARLVELLEQV